MESCFKNKLMHCCSQTFHLLCRQWLSINYVTIRTLAFRKSYQIFVIGCHCCTPVLRICDYSCVENTNMKQDGEGEGFPIYCNIRQEGASPICYNFTQGAIKVNCNITVFEGKWNVILLLQFQMEIKVSISYISSIFVWHMITRFVPNLEKISRLRSFRGYAQDDYNITQGGRPNLLKCYMGGKWSLKTPKYSAINGQPHSRRLAILSHNEIQIPSICRTSPAKDSPLGVSFQSNCLQDYI